MNNDQMLAVLFGVAVGCILLLGALIGFIINWVLLWLN